MDINIYCIWCGGRLCTEDGHVSCVSCDTKYSDVIMSETRRDDEKAVTLETSISMECLLVKPKFEKALVPGLLNVPVEEAVAF
jgi:uncharacterized Zn finger protein (UPF0148 family)